MSRYSRSFWIRYCFHCQSKLPPGGPVALRCQLENLPGDLDLYLVFHGTGEELIRLEWFKFWS